MAVQLKDIAQVCGLSVSAVSLALRDSPKVSNATRERVQKLATKMGYQPNRSVSRVMSEIRSLAGNRYKETLGYLIFHPPGGEKQHWEKPLFTGAQQRAQALGYGLDYFEIDNLDHALRATLRVMKARGIRGVIIAPFQASQVQLDVSIDHLAVVTIGYTLQQPDLHRIARDMSHSIHQTISLIKTAGYQRIGYVAEEEHEARMEHVPLSSYLLNDWMLDRNMRTQPFVREKIAKGDFVEWYRAHQPDIIITMKNEIGGWLDEERVRIPEDVSLFQLNCDTAEDEGSGFYPNYEGLGAAAVEQVSGFVERRELGVPQLPQTLLIKGLYVEGKTLSRPLAEANRLPFRV